MPTQTIVLPPAFGEATVLEWLVAVGQVVTPTTPVVRILAGEAEWVLPAQCAGVLIGPLAEPGACVKSGAILAHCAPPRRLRATPLARRIAMVLGVDLTKLTGHGPGGRIERADVLAAVAATVVGSSGSSTLAPEPTLVISSPAPDPAGEFAALTLSADNQNRSTAAVAEPLPNGHQSESVTVTTVLPPIPTTDLLPLASVTIAIDARPLLHHAAAQAAEFAARGLQSTPLSILIAAAAALFPMHPLLNAAWTDTAILVRHRYHVAAGLPNGRWVLVTDAGDLTERGVARALTRECSDLSAATCVIATTSGWWQIVPPLPGTAAALSLSAIHPQPVALDETTLVAGAVAQLSLCYDARILDHPTAMVFLNALCRRLGVTIYGARQGDT